MSRLFVVAAAFIVLIGAVVVLWPDHQGSEGSEVSTQMFDEDQPKKLDDGPIVIGRSFVPEVLAEEEGPPDTSRWDTEEPSAGVDFYGQVHVLCVGIDHFPRGNIEPRSFLEQDAKDLNDLLRARYGYRVETLIGAEAKKSAIKNAVQRLGAVGSDDAVILFFATHGKELKYTDDAGNPVQAGYLLPWDAPLDMNDTSKPEEWEEHAVSFAWLGDQLEASNARHVLVLLNTCHSGYIGLGQSGPPSESLESSVTKPSRAAITAGLSGQEAREPKPGEKVTDPLNGSVLQNSHFTHYLLSALSADDAMGATELHASLNQGLRTLTGNDATYAMWPQYRESADSTGEFVFIPRSFDKAGLDAAIERFDARRLERRRNRIQPSETLRVLYTPDPAFAVDREERERQWQQRTQIYTENAGLGDAEAMAALSHCFQLGLGVDKDPDAAFRWASSAYERGTGSGLYALAKCYRDGIGVEANPILADRLLRKSFDLDYPAAVYDESVAIDDLLAERSDTDSDDYQAQLEKRIDLVRRAAEGGLGRAQHELAMAHLWGKGGATRSGDEVKRWAEAAIESGDAYGHLALADLYIGSHPLVAADPARARRHLLASAEAGIAQAQYFTGLLMLGEDYAVPEGTTNPFALDPSSGVKWLQLAADQGHSRAVFELGLIYAQGRHRPVDYRLAHNYMTRAAEEGVADAVFKLFAWHMNGDVVQQDTRQAIRYLHEAADLRHAIAQFVLGSYYYDGLHVEADPARGLSYLALACEQEMLPAVGTVCMILYYMNPPWDVHQDDIAYNMWGWHAETRLAKKAWDDFLARYPEESDSLERTVLNGPELLLRFMESPGEDTNQRHLQHQLAVRLIAKHLEANTDLVVTAIVPAIAKQSPRKQYYLKLLSDLDGGSGAVVRQLREANDTSSNDPDLQAAITEAIAAIQSTGGRR